MATEALIPRAINAVPLVLDAVFRPNFNDDLVNQNPILSQSKLLAGSILSETQVLLGWLIDTRQLKLFITKEKTKRILIFFDHMEKDDQMEKEDLKLWMTIVDVITEGNMGRSTNSILPTMASILCISDACEHGIGGLIIINGIGFTWRFIIPDEWMHYFSINILEFVLVHHNVSSMYAHSSQAKDWYQSETA